jgi:hypothetical protein
MRLEKELTAFQHRCSNHLTRDLSMLRLYVDDSGKEDHSPNLILAGYLSTVERWELFSKEWKKILDANRLDAFRMADAWRLARKYSHVGPLKRDQIVIQIIECIKKHAEMAFVSSVPFEGFHHFMDVKQDHTHSLGRPYFMNFYSLLVRFYKFAYQHKFDQAIEIIFDEQGGESKQFVLEGMEEFRRIAAKEFPGLVIATPTFQSDKDALPLQAADALAWLVRRDAYKLVKGVDRSKTIESLLLGEALSIPNDVVIWDEKKLSTASKAIIQYLNKTVDLGSRVKPDYGE